MILIALGVLAVVVTVGFILFATVVGAGVALTVGAVLRRKFARARGDLPRESSVRARLDPSMEVHPDRQRLPRADENDSADPRVSE